MRYKIMILILVTLSVTRIYAQRSPHVFQDDKYNIYQYFILNAPENAKYEIDKVNVKSSSDYNCDKCIFEAELYNLHLSNQGLILFSVLPSKTDNKANWVKISLDSIRTHLISIKQLDSLHKKNTNLYRSFRYRETDLIKLKAFKIIIRKSDGYYVNASDCLTEFFCEYGLNPNAGFANQNLLSLIDTTLAPLSAAEFEMQYFRKYGYYSYNNKYLENVDPGFRPPAFNFPTLFYSHSLEILKKKGYFFWTLSSGIIDGYTKNIFINGIDRFIYQPDIGIIAGDYPSYFIYATNSVIPENCGKLEFYHYLNNEVKLMPVTITRNIQLN